MIISKDKLKKIFDEVKHEKGFINFKEYKELLNKLLEMSKTDKIFITRCEFQEMTEAIMNNFDNNDKNTFMKICTLAYLDMKIFS